MSRPQGGLEEKTAELLPVYLSFRRADEHQSGKRKRTNVEILSITKTDRVARSVNAW